MKTSSDIQVRLEYAKQRAAGLAREVSELQERLTSAREQLDYNNTISEVLGWVMRDSFTKGDLK